VALRRFPGMYVSMASASLLALVPLMGWGGGSIVALDVDCIDFGISWRVLTKFARRVALYLLLLMLSIRKSRQREGLSWLELRRVVLIIDAVY
jgi:hypothetical protein